MKQQKGGGRNINPPKGNSAPSGPPLAGPSENRGNPQHRSSPLKRLKKKNSPPNLQQPVNDPGRDGPGPDWQGFKLKLNPPSEQKKIRLHLEPDPGEEMGYNVTNLDGIYGGPGFKMKIVVPKDYEKTKLYMHPDEGNANGYTVGVELDGEQNAPIWKRFCCCCCPPIKADDDEEQPDKKEGT